MDYSSYQSAIKYLQQQVTLNGNDSDETIQSIADKYELGYVEAPIIEPVSDEVGTNTESFSMSELHRLANTNPNEVVWKPIYKDHARKDPHFHGFLAKRYIGEDGRLHVGAFIFKNNEKSLKIHQDILAGNISHLSVGYDLIKDQTTGNILQKNFQETSLTSQPVKQFARISKCFSHPDMESSVPALSTPSAADEPVPAEQPQTLSDDQDFFQLSPEEQAKEVFKLKREAAEAKKTQQEIERLRAEAKLVQDSQSKIQEYDNLKQKLEDERQRSKLPELKDLVDMTTSFETIQPPQVDPETGEYVVSEEAELLRKAVLDEGSELHTFYTKVLLPLKERHANAIKEKQDNEQKFTSEKQAEENRKRALKATQELERQHNMSLPRKRSTPPETEEPSAPKQQRTSSIWSMFNEHVPVTVPVAHSYGDAPTTSSSSSSVLTEYLPSDSTYLGQFGGQPGVPYVSRHNLRAFGRSTTATTSVQHSLGDVGTPAANKLAEEAEKRRIALVKPHLFYPYNQDADEEDNLNQFKHAFWVDPTPDVNNWWNGEALFLYRNTANPAIEYDADGCIVAKNYGVSKFSPAQIAEYNAAVQEYGVVVRSS